MEGRSGRTQSEHAYRLLLAAGGLALLAAAARADGRWVDRHVMLPFYFRPDLPAWVIGAVRGALALGGVLLLVRTRRPAGGPGVSRAGALAAVLASIVAVEGLLQVLPLHAASGSPRYELKVGQRHPRFGWIARPSRTTTLSAGGGPYTYAVNALGLRAPSETTATDLSRPALVVTGESIASGFGLPYDETFAARCGRTLGLEVVNVAEGGYGLDQAYLRLADILPRVQRPAVVVTVLVGPEVGRLARDDRPRLVLDDAGAFELVPRATGFFAGTRLHDVFHNRLPYLGEASLAREERLAAALVQAIARAATARGARPLFVLPSVGPPRPFEQHRERALWQRLFADPGLSYVVVDLPASELLPWNRHPDAAGAGRIAAAIEAALKPAAPLQVNAPHITQ